MEGKVQAVKEDSVKSEEWRGEREEREKPREKQKNPGVIKRQREEDSRQKEKRRRRKGLAGMPGAGILSVLH